MNPQDLRLIVIVALGLLVAMLVGLMLVESRRRRSLTAELILRDADVSAAQRTIAVLEVEARAAAELRTQMVAARSAIAYANAERDRYATALATKQAEAQAVEAWGRELEAWCRKLEADLERYRALRDCEDELERLRGIIAAAERDGAALVDEVENARRGAHDEIASLQAQIAELRRELGWFEQEHYFVSFGLYAPRYDFANSAEYKAKLELVREQQRQMTKDGHAASCSTEWSVAGSAKAGAKLVADQLRLMLRAFNGECDAAIANLTPQNVEAIAERIKKAHEAVNKLGLAKHCEISVPYLKLKLDELYVFHEYRLKKDAERDEQRAIQEQIRDEKRALEELERARKQVEQDERRYEQALAKARVEVEQATGDTHERLQQQIAALERQVAEAHERQRSISQAELTRAGHVYVISNIGSFGEHIYKIGMTRRLDPQDRVTELGDASVPFPFDVHAIISTGDAPKLENELHRLFTDRRVNAVNHRKEFFAVTLDEVEAAVHRLHGHIEFTKIADASEYRASVATRVPQPVPSNGQPHVAEAVAVVAQA